MGRSVPSFTGLMMVLSRLHLKWREICLELGEQWTTTNRQLPIHTTNNQAAQLSQGLTCSRFQFMATRIQLSQLALALKLSTQWVVRFKPQSSYSHLTLKHESSICKSR